MVALRIFQAGLVLLLALGAAVARAADRGIYTIVDGDARVLRATTWYRLAAGARAGEGDVIDVGERARVQLELSGGAVLNIQGPALAHAAALPLVEDKAPAGADVTLLRGWFKAAATPKARMLRLRLPAAMVEIANGVVVVHGDSTLVEVFVEKGSAAISTAPAARGKEAVAREANEGEFWRRVGDRVFITDERPPAAFVAAMPRDLRDPLPGLASRFPTAPAPLAGGREITFAEAEPWLAGASRKVFARRFAPRLSDPAFRSAAAARPIPEWDRTLHPERYRPKDARPVP